MTDNWLVGPDLFLQNHPMLGEFLANLKRNYYPPVEDFVQRNPLLSFSRPAGIAISLSLFPGIENLTNYITLDFIFLPAIFLPSLYDLPLLSG